MSPEEDAQLERFVIDDARPSSMGLSDFLKLLDNNTPSSVKSRYKNKYLNCDLIIITTVLSINSFYRNVFESEKEPIDQLKRRCRILVEMNRFYIKVYRWDSFFMKYRKPVYFDNDLLEEYIPTTKSKKEIKEEVCEMFPFLTYSELTEGKSAFELEGPVLSGGYAKNSSAESPAELTKEEKELEEESKKLWKCSLDTV